MADTAANPPLRSAAADGPCYWIEYQVDSNCDGVLLGSDIFTECSDTEKIVESQPLGELATINLYYSTGCRAVSADLWLYGNPPSGTYCFVEILRSPYGKEYNAGYPGHGPGGIYSTPLLYNADTQAYARAYCNWGDEPEHYYAETGWW
ncbi:hypothetical protein ACPZ19_26700 [Amycolatopsis lurida]